MQNYMEQFRQMIELRGLTDNTLKSYVSYLTTYLFYLETQIQKIPEQVSWQELRGYILYLKNGKKLNPRSINAHIAQLQFFYLYVLHIPWDRYQIPVLKFDTYMPLVLSQEKVQIFIDTLENLKHKAVVALLYSAGLRVSEVCRLKYEDISRNDMTIHVTRSKNRSDRYAILSKNALSILSAYWFAFGKPKGFLFPGMGKVEKPIVCFTVHRFIKDHVNRLQWNASISPHTFRHSFGTHLYENGTDLLAIKDALGHKSLSSTAIYVQSGNIKHRPTRSPFDTAIEVTMP